jgi:Fic family protein
VAGFVSMYDYIMETDDIIDAYKIIKLNKKLFQFTPFPEEAGKIRSTNNLVVGAKMEITDWHNVPRQIVELDKMIKKLIKEKEKLSVSEYIDKVVKIHYKITLIHPFKDGNGRVARGIMNRLFKINKLPLVYLKFPHKEKYYNALRNADLENDFTSLYKLFYQEVLRTMIDLNSKFKI